MITDRFFTTNDGNGELEPPSDCFVALHTKDRNWSMAGAPLDEIIAILLTVSLNLLGKVKAQLYPADMVQWGVLHRPNHQ